MKILFVAPAWVGDMVMAQSLFKKVKNDYPDAIMDAVGPEWSLPLIDRMPEIRRGIALSIGHGRLRLLKRMRTGRGLAGESYDRAIILPTTWKSALVPFFARIPLRTGFVGEFRFGLVNDLRELDKKVLNMTVLRYLALGEDKDAKLPPEIRFYPELEVNHENSNRLINDLELSRDRPVIVFCPGAEYGPAKQWPVEYYRDLAAKLISVGYQVWTLGSAGEKEIGRQIDPGTRGGGYRNLCGRTRLEDTIDLLALASHAVSNDSGLMHVAGAVGIKVEAIFGSSSPEYTPPLSDRANIHCLGLECSPCFKSACSYDHLKCLYEIYPEKILESILKS